MESHCVSWSYESEIMSQNSDKTLRDYNLASVMLGRVVARGVYHCLGSFYDPSFKIDAQGYSEIRKDI